MTEYGDSFDFEHNIVNAAKAVVRGYDGAENIEARVDMLAHRILAMRRKTKQEGVNVSTLGQIVAAHAEAFVFECALGQIVDTRDRQSATLESLRVAVRVYERARKARLHKTWAKSNREWMTTRPPTT